MLSTTYLKPFRITSFALSYVDVQVNKFITLSYERKLLFNSILVISLYRISKLCWVNCGVFSFLMFCYLSWQSLSWFLHNCMVDNTFRFDHEGEERRPTSLFLDGPIQIQIKYRLDYCLWETFYFIVYKSNFVLTTLRLPKKWWFIIIS